MTTLASDKARANWRDVLDSAGKGEDIVVERYGKPAVAIIAYDDYLAIQEMLAEMREAREAQRVLEAWRTDPESARPWQDVKEDLLASDQ